MPKRRERQIQVDLPGHGVPFRERLACSVADAEEASGISRSQLYLEMKAGRLEFFMRGSRRLIRVPSLLRLLTE